MNSGIDWTLLRPGRFMSNALGWRPMIQRGDTVRVPFARRPAASIDPADIAAIAVVALTTQNHRNIAYQLSGPQALTPADELTILAEVLSRPLRLVEASVEDARAGMLAAGMSPLVVEAAIARTLEGKDGTELLPMVARSSAAPRPASRSGPPPTPHCSPTPVRNNEGDAAMTGTTDEQVRELGRRWVEAEQRGDVDTLDAISADDFTLVGPVGFVLNKQQWLDRYRNDAFVTRSLVWDGIEVRDYGDAAVAIGCHTQQASYQGQLVDGQFRATHIVVRRHDQWLLAGLHLSPIGGPPPFRPPAQPSQAT
jgi:ketosteroid isomerase-like protein